MIWPFNKGLRAVMIALNRAEASRADKSNSTRTAFRENEESARSIKRLAETIDAADTISMPPRRRYGAAE